MPGRASKHLALLASSAPLSKARWGLACYLSLTELESMMRESSQQNKGTARHF